MTEIVNALAYARVSTPDQADSDLSLPAQVKGIREYAQRTGIAIVGEYIDEGVSAYTDDNKRIQFQAMIQRALRDSAINHILVHDASRFFRNKYRAASVKAELLARGVTVVSVTSPYDPRTVDGAWRESIDETIGHDDLNEHRISHSQGHEGKRHKKRPDDRLLLQERWHPALWLRRPTSACGKGQQG